MVTQFIEVTTSWLTGVIGMIIASFSGIVPLFWTEGVGEAPGSFTFVGTLLLFGLGMSIAMLGLTFIRGLIARKRG